MSGRSKTLATWIALVAGSLGAHRFYLHGFRDIAGWLYWPLTLLGLHGVHRMRALGQDDVLAWLLVPLLGVTLCASMLAAIVYALTPDATWNTRRKQPERTSIGWLNVIAAVLALFLGGTALMATIAFSAQRFFEWQLRTEAGSASRTAPR